MFNIIQLKITLDEVKPPVWRRILVQDNIDFYNFHLLIQKAMGWKNKHLFGFDLKEYYINCDYDWESDKNTIYIERDLNFVSFLQEEQRKEYYEKYKEYKAKEKLMLSDFLNKEKQKIKYTYNYKYGWDHTIMVEKISQPEPSISYPVCIKGKRACPPDTFDLEIRGAIDYMEICEELQENPNNPKYKYFKDEYKKVYSRDFDPEYFDLNEINEKLKELNIESLYGR